MDVVGAFNELIAKEEINKNNVEVINIMMRMLKDPHFKNDFIGPKKTYLPIEGYPFKLFMERLCFEDGFYRSLLKTSWKKPQKIIEPLMYFQNMIEIEATDSKNHSPSGTTPEVYNNTSVIKYKIANQSFEIPLKKAELYSFAEYENVKQSKLFPFGIFGRDWMKENQAIIDYANNILYFKHSKTVKQK